MWDQEKETHPVFQNAGTNKYFGKKIFEWMWLNGLIQSALHLCTFCLSLFGYAISASDKIVLLAHVRGQIIYVNGRPVVSYSAYLQK